MQRYRDYAQGTRNGVLVPIPLPRVKVFAHGTLTLAPLFKDADGLMALDNPFFGSARGEIVFYAADGRYDIEVSRSGFDTQLTVDVTLGSGEIKQQLDQTIEAIGTAAIDVAVLRPPGEKLGRMIDIGDTGAAGANGAGDAAAIQALFSSNDAIGQTLRGARGEYKITSAKWTMQRHFDLDLGVATTLRADQTTGQRFDVLEINVLQSFGETTPSTSGEWRGGWLRGGRLFTNNITPGGGATAAGGWAINVGAGSSKPVNGLTIEKMNLSGGYGAVKFRGSDAGGSGVGWSQIVRCQLANGVVFAGDDGQIAVDCIASGTNAAYTFSVTEGAFCCGVFRGTASTKGGAVNLLDGSKVKLHDVQMEHSGTAGTGLPYGGQVYAAGTTYKGFANELIGCNLGAGYYITNTVTVANQAHFFIDRNQFNTANDGASADLLLVNDTDPANDPYDTVVGYFNTYRGTRALQTSSVLTDVTRRMIVAITGAGGALRQPHRGLWLGNFIGVLTDQCSGLNSLGFEVMIEHSGRVAIQGGLGRSAGTFTASLVVCRFPAWILPVRSQYLLVFDEAGNTESAYLVAGGGADNGKLFINGSKIAASNKLFFATTWMAVVNPDYPLSI